MTIIDIFGLCNHCLFCVHNRWAGGLQQLHRWLLPVSFYCIFFFRNICLFISAAMQFKLCWSFLEHFAGIFWREQRFDCVFLPVLWPPAIVCIRFHFQSSLTRLPEIQAARHRGTSYEFFPQLTQSVLLSLSSLIWAHLLLARLKLKDFLCSESWSVLYENPE